VYQQAVERSAVATMAMLIPIGFCIIGPQVLLVGTAPADLAHRGTSAAAAGFVNFMGYIGAATGDVATGHFSSSEHGGWQTAIYVWAVWAFAGAAIMAILWNTTSKKVGVLPGYVPKIGAFVALAAAAEAIDYGELPLAAYAATFLRHLWRFAASELVTQIDASQCRRWRWRRSHWYLCSSAMYADRMGSPGSNRFP
jgi:hypothetical protein